MLTGWFGGTPDLVADEIWNRLEDEEIDEISFESWTDDEDLQAKLLVMTGPRRLDVATALREAMEDRRLGIPPDDALRRDLHSVRAESGPTGGARLVAERGGSDRHADRFWEAARVRHERWRETAICRPECVLHQTTAWVRFSRAIPVPDVS